MRARLRSGEPGSCRTPTKPNPQSLRSSEVEGRDADEQIERPAQLHPTIETGQAVPLAKNAIDVTVVCEDPVGPDDRGSRATSRSCRPGSFGRRSLFRALNGWRLSPGLRPFPEATHVGPVSAQASRASQPAASKLVNFVFMLRRTPTEHEAQERRRCDRLLCVARLLSA